jgi:uncharacterized RDD family membrane protein YckC
MLALEGLPLASFRRRAAAIIIDFVAVFVLAAAIAEPVGSLWERTHPGTHLKIVLAFGPGANWYSIAAVATYFTLSVFATNGLTLGKRLCGIRIVSTVHERISLWHALERALGYVVSAGELGLGFGQYFTTSNCRTTHDRIAQTIVVRTSGDAAGTPGQGASGSTRGVPDRGQSRPDSPDATATLALPTRTQVPQRGGEAKDTTNAKP